MKNFRILRIAQIFYKDLVKEIYDKNNTLFELSYIEQQKEIFKNCFVYSNSFSKQMNKLGHDTYEIIFDLEILQKRWADEHNVKYSSKNWIKEILLAQIKYFKPDILYFQDTNSLSYSIRKKLKNEFSFIKLIIIYRGSSSNLSNVNDADLLFLGIPSLVKRYSITGLNAHLLYHAFDKNIFDQFKRKNDEKQYNLTFIGSSGFGRGLIHRERYWWLIELIKNTNIQLWINETLQKKNHFIRTTIDQLIYHTSSNILITKDHDFINHFIHKYSIPKKIRRIALELFYDNNLKDINGSKLDTKKWPTHKIAALFPKRCHEAVFGLDMYKMLKKSKVTFNKHPASAFGSVGNMRMFEATGIGTCLLTDWGNNIDDLFVEDEEVITYRSIEECIEKVTYILENPYELKKIAAAGQKRTLKDHTYENRCNQINDHIQKLT